MEDEENLPVVTSDIRETLARSAVKPAVFSGNGLYRYYLHRRVSNVDSGIATFIMLNPSTADATNNDPTIRKCIGFCRQWGYGQLQVVNLFAVRAVRPSEMKKSPYPIGRSNRRWVERAIDNCSRADQARAVVVCAWGVHGDHRNQDCVVLEWLAALGVQLQCLGVTRAGHPRHPLYLPYTTELIPYQRMTARV